MHRKNPLTPFMDTGYFNILHRTDTEDKEKTSEISRFQRLASVW